MNEGRKSKPRWADLPEAERYRLGRLKVAKVVMARLERQRRLSLRERLKREGKYRSPNLDRVSCSRIERSALASAERCRVLLLEWDTLQGRAKRRLTQRLIVERAILGMEAELRKRLERLAEVIRGTGTEVEIVVGDVTDAAIRGEAIETARRAYGGLDMLINNAGIGALGKFADADPQRLRRIMAVNFFATAEMIRAALPSLREGTRPIVVNISSVLGHRGVPLCSEYCASKFAVQGLSESLRAEFSREGIDLLVVSPSTTESEFFQSVIEQTEHVDRTARRTTPAATVAKKTVRAIARGKHEIVISFLGWLLTWGNRQNPRLLDYLLAKYGQ